MSTEDGHTDNLPSAASRLRWLGIMVEDAQDRSLWSNQTLRIGLRADDAVPLLLA